MSKTTNGRQIDHAPSIKPLRKFGPKAVEVAQRIRSLRLRNNMSCVELGQETALQAIAIRRIEQGGRRVDVDDLCILAEALGVSATYLLHGNGRDEVASSHESAGTTVEGRPDDSAEESYPPAEEPSQMITRAEAAAYLGITDRALQQLNYLGTGPTFVIVGSRTVRYRIQDLEQYIDERTFTQASEVKRSHLIHGLEEDE